MTLAATAPADTAARFPVSRASRRGGLKGRERRMGQLLLLPALLAFALVIVWPFVQSLAMSLFRSTLDTTEPRFIGFANFRTIFHSPEIGGSFLVTAIYVVCVTSGTIVMGLGWALILNQTFRGRGVLRALTLLPWVMPSTVSAFVFAWIFNSRFGVLNAVLLQTGAIDFPKAWLSTPEGALVAVVLTRMWQSIPLYMSFFLAGLQNLDRDQIEAARVDGATNWPVLRDHILPHLRPVLMVVIILGVIGNLQSFDTIYALTQGGPVRATAVLSVEVYRRAFEQWDIGMASAIGVLWVATLLPPVYFYLRLMARRT